jgi:16S rRNA (cytidine1402-2'-O)-methyltransferase
MDTHRFTFYGFLPRRGDEREHTLAELLSLTHTAVVYEAPTRLVDTLTELEARGAGVRQAAVAREMTKQYEEVRRGTLSALRAYYEDAPPRGEVVIVLAGAAKPRADETHARDRARALRAEGKTTRDVAARLSAELGVARNRAYQIAQEES